MGAENSWLGYPVADEVGLPDGVGRMSRFEHGWIYWHPRYGAHPVGMDIFGQWEAQGYERGAWGYPTSDPVMDADGAYETQKFQGGEKTGLTPPLWIVAEVFSRELINETISRGRQYAAQSRIPTKDALKANGSQVSYQAIRAGFGGLRTMNRSMDYSLNSFLDNNLLSPASDVPRNSKIIEDPSTHRAGDVYKNFAGVGSVNKFAPQKIEHNLAFDHEGMFVANDLIVEAKGMRETVQYFNIENQENRGEIERFHPIESVSEDIIQNAVEYARWAADSRIPYDYNPTFNKIDNFDGRLNCSELVWRAYWNGGKGIDLDGGNKLKPGVFPRDIIASPYLSRY